MTAAIQAVGDVAVGVDVVTTHATGVLGGGDAVVQHHRDAAMVAALDLFIRQCGAGDHAVDLVTQHFGDHIAGAHLLGDREQQQMKAATQQLDVQLEQNFRRVARRRFGDQHGHDVGTARDQRACNGVGRIVQLSRRGQHALAHFFGDRRAGLEAARHGGLGNAGQSGHVVGRCTAEFSRRAVGFQSFLGHWSPA